MPNFIIVFISIINPFYGFFAGLIGLYADRKHWKSYIFCITLFFAHLSYCHIPVNNDLNRYFDYIIELRGKSLSDTLTYKYEGVNLYVFSFFAWLSNVVHDEHLVPFFSVFIVYYIAFYCTCFVGKHEKIKWKYVCNYVLFQMLTLDWYSITNNVRNVAAFSIIGLAIFRDVYMRRRNLVTIMCYIAPIFLHPTAAFFILVRIIIAFVKTNKTRTILLIGTIMINPIVDFLNRNVSSITSNEMIGFVVRKAYNYLFDTNSAYGLAVQASMRSWVTRILYLTLAILFLVMFFSLMNNRKENTYKIFFKETAASYQSYIVITALMALACSTMLRPEYWRFTATMIVFGSGVVLLFLDCDKPKIIALIKYPFWGVAVMCFVVWGYQLTWFDFGQQFVDMMLSSPVAVLMKYLLAV